ncbi:MAG: glucose 1-dehydrogenase [Halieaceae bacterium]|jgi:3alpha(or 20beta)-hydroxysteroid dehydrogenase|nr:glucose 1-dehydrogenase [Halieaceae bacterium]
MKKLEGKVALITGGARGQGEAEARLFVEQGARVIIADVTDDAGAEVARSLGDAAHSIHLDVASEENWTAAIAETLDVFGRLDILVNNAGIFRIGLLESLSLADYMAVIEVNQVGVFLGMRAVVQAMRGAGGGSIVNISSTAGREGVEGMIGYVGSKWAVRGMTKTAAMELGRYGIRVNSVHPGAVDTPLINSGEFAGVDQSAAYAGLPIPRVGQPEELAKLVLFLACDDSSYSTGSEFTADGGRLAGIREPGIVAE